MSYVSALVSWLRHRLHLNRGTVTSEWRGRELWIGFACVECGNVHGWFKSPHVTRPEPTP